VKSGIRNQESGIRDQELGIRNLELGIRERDSDVGKFPIPNPPFCYSAPFPYLFIFIELSHEK
jgi:hypothetical protein